MDVEGADCVLMLLRSLLKLLLKVLELIILLFSADLDPFLSFKSDHVKARLLLLELSLEEAQLLLMFHF